MMTKIIEVGFKKETIPVKIGGMLFELPTGEKFRRTYLEQLALVRKNTISYEKELQEAMDKEDFTAIEEVNKRLFEQSKNFADSILGDGSFDKMFAVCDDSDVILEAVSEVIEQATALQNQKLGQSYVTGKKG
jgi:hypothetical protein